MSTKGTTVVPQALKAELLDGETRGQALGRLAVSHAMDATVTLSGYVAPIFRGEMDINALADELVSRTKAVQGKDLSSLESMLTLQAETLNAIFNATAQRAAQQIGQAPQAADLYLRLAMRAQGQCRATVQTLAEMKTPRPVAYVQQANIAAGHQQIHNHPQQAHAENAQSGLLEASHVTRLDARTPGTASRGHPPLEAVGVIDGTANGSRKSRHAA